MLRLYDSVQQFISKSGVPLSSGKVWVYLNGTDDLASVYADPNGLVPLQNPLDVDDDGRTLGAFVDQAKVYRLEVRDYTGALQWSVYPVSPLGGSGGGTGVVPVIVSSDGSVTVDQTVDGNRIIFDLSAHVEDSAESLAWYRGDGCTVSGDIYVPGKTAGTLEQGEGGVWLPEHQYFHVTYHVRAQKTSAEPYYDKVDFLLQLMDGYTSEVTNVCRRSAVVDWSMGLSQDFEFSTDVMTESASELQLRILSQSVQGGNFTLLDTEIHRVYSGAPYIPGGAGGGDYEGGTGILVNNTTREISVDSSVVALKDDLSQYVTDSELETILEGYVTAGDGISVTDGKVSIDMVENHGLSIDYPAYDTEYSTYYFGTQWLKFGSTFTAPGGQVSISTASTSFNLENSLGTYTGCHLRFALAREVTGSPGEIIYLGKKNLKSMGTEVVVNGVIVNCPYGLDGGSGEWDDMWETTTTPPSDIGYCGIVAVDDNGNIVGNPLTMPREYSLNITMTSLHGKLKLDNPLPASTMQDNGKVLTVDYWGNPTWDRQPIELPSYSASDSQKSLVVDYYGQLEWADRLPGQLFVLPDNVYSEYNNIPGWSWTSFKASIDANVASGTPMMVVRKSASNHPAGETAFYYHATHDDRLGAGDWVYVFGTVIAKDQYNFGDGPSGVPMPGQVTYTFYKYGEDNVRVSIDNKPILYCPSMDYVQDGSVLTVDMYTDPSGVSPSSTSLRWARRQDVPVVDVDYRYDHEQHEAVLRTDINTIWSSVVTEIIYGRTPALSVNFDGHIPTEFPTYGRHRFMVETTDIQEDYSAHDYYGSAVFMANIYDRWTGTWRTYSGILSKANVNATPTLTWESVPTPTIGTVTV